MEFLANPEVWLSLLTLTFMEIVLGIDNIIFISIAVAKLPESQHKKATNIGMVLAMVFRIILLFGICSDGKGGTQFRSPFLVLLDASCPHKTWPHRIQGSRGPF